MKVTNEFKTGIMLVIVLIILGYFVYAAGDFKVGGEGYDVTALFGSISGLRQNAPVRLSGAEVGKIKNIEIIIDEKKKTRIAVTLWIENDVKIREDAEFYISTLGLMGEKYIEIASGSKDSAFLAPGDKVKGQDPVEMQVLMSKADTIAVNLNKTLLQVGKLSRHADEILVKKGGQIADNLDQTIVSVKKLSDHADDIITKKEIDNILKNLEKTSSNFEKFSSDIKRHPWKLIWKTKENDEDEDEDEEESDKEKGIEFKKGLIE